MARNNHDKVRLKNKAEELVRHLKYRVNHSE